MTSKQSSELYKSLKEIGLKVYPKRIRSSIFVGFIATTMRWMRSMGNNDRVGIMYFDGNAGNRSGIQNPSVDIEFGFKI